MIGFLSSIDADSFNSKGGDESWNATLARNDLPSNVYIGISIPYKKGRLTTLDVFQQRIDYFTGLALSVTWLNEYISQHLDTEVELRFVEDRSFSQKAVETFKEDMKNLGKDEFLQQIAGELRDSAFLQIREKGCSSRWIVLPDRRMV